MPPIAPISNTADMPSAVAAPAAASATVSAATPSAPTVAAPAPPSDDVPVPVRSAGALQAQLDELLAESRSELRFRVDEDTRRVVVSVIDGNGDVVMQVPDATALALARRLAQGGHLLDLHA